MNSTVPDDELRELDEDTRRAWADYQEQLRELSGDAYERVEPDAWQTLQAELGELAERRERLAGSASTGDVG